MKRTDLDWGYLLSFMSVATLAGLLPAACSENEDDARGPASSEQVGGAEAAGGNAGQEAGAGSGGQQSEVGGEGPGAGGTGETGSAGGGQGGEGPTCNEPKSACGDSCVDLSSSLEHCGSCDHPCTGSDACVAGKCEARVWGVPHINAGFDLFNPIVQLADDGTAYVIAQSFAAKQLLKVVAIDPTGPGPGFSRQLPSLEHEEKISEFRAARNRKGQMLVAFITSDAPRKLYAAPFLGEAFGDPILLDDSGLGVGSSPYIDGGFNLSLADDGVATVVYRRLQEGSPNAQDLLAVSSRGFDKAWGKPAPLEGADATVPDHHVADDGRGRLLVTWVQENRVLASRFADGEWSSASTISEEGKLVGQSRGALTPDGKAAIVFSQAESLKGDLYRATFDGEAWSSPLPLVLSPFEETYPGVALRADGSGIFSYEVRGGVGGQDRVFAIPFENLSEVSAVGKELTATLIVGQAPRAFVGPGRSGGVFWGNNDNSNRTKVALTEGADFSEWAIPSGPYHGVIPSIDFNDAGDGIVVWHDSSANLGYRRYEVWAVP